MIPGPLSPEDANCENNSAFTGGESSLVVALMSAAALLGLGLRYAGRTAS
ncbi:MAG: hypothetical protein U1E22_06315 [Coriobacteriia bacterium]|nr:hypothetical protein [Coriobacteriia bacterium]